MIRYSTHAAKRIREREITKEDISETLEAPVETKEFRFGRQGAFRHLAGNSFLVVIFERRNEDLIVVTALKVDRDRVRRYGFTRI